MTQINAAGGGRQVTLLDRILDSVKPGKSEVTIDVDGYTKEQINQITVEAKSRGLHVSGTHRWLLIRDLRPVERVRKMYSYDRTSAFTEPDWEALQADAPLLKRDLENIASKIEGVIKKKDERGLRKTVSELKTFVSEFEKSMDTTV
jgi:hypothetical protein